MLFMQLEHKGNPPMILGSKSTGYVSLWTEDTGIGIQRMVW